MIASLADGLVSVVVTCFQMQAFGPSGQNVPARVGTRVVEASMASISGLTDKPVHFASCDECRAVSGFLGVAGDDCQSFQFVPGDPRAKLLCQITESDSREGWAKPMVAPARVVGLINVHCAIKMSERARGTCFHCGHVF